MRLASPCPEHARLVSDYFHRELSLSLDERRAAEAALEHCPECVAWRAAPEVGAGEPTCAPDDAWTDDVEVETGAQANDDIGWAEWREVAGAPPRATDHAMGPIRLGGEGSLDLPVWMVPPVTLRTRRAGEAALAPGDRRFTKKFIGILAPEAGEFVAEVTDSAGQVWRFRYRVEAPGP